MPYRKKASFLKASTYGLWKQGNIKIKKLPDFTMESGSFLYITAELLYITTELLYVTAQLFACNRAAFACNRGAFCM